MDENSEQTGGGILKGLKRILFYADQDKGRPSGQESSAQAPVIAPVPRPEQSFGSVTDPDAVKQMKLKVYQLLEQMNKPGVDFFEVWNASVEMGGSTASNIRSAFTSLRFADSTLSKDKLLESGRGYIAGLESVIAKESAKREEERKMLEAEMERAAISLSTEIGSLEKQISEMQRTLSAKITERDSLTDRYSPKLAEISFKISHGKNSVQQVMDEMQQVLAIIQQEIK
jgi:hypothetical protein